MGKNDTIPEIKDLEEEIKRLKKELKKRKKYGLVWEDKTEDVASQCKTELPVLCEVKDRELCTSAYLPKNFLIEGDNYHVLSVLNYTHKKGIDIIYIDPPYNTGAKDWKYNNNYVDEHDAFRHSKWLSFMEKRLKLAKGLLKNNGVLICTIDKNEQANLGVLLNELFFDREIVCVTIIHNPGGIQGNNFSHTNEYAYFIHPSKGKYISTKARDDVPSTAFRDWGKATSKRDSAKTCFYPIFVKDNKITGFGEVSPDNYHPESPNILRDDGVVEVYPVDNKGVERKWRFGRETVEGIIDELTCKYIKDEISIYREKKDFRWKTVWTDSKYNANVYGTKLLNNIIETRFPYPKSLYAVMDCINAVIHDNDNAIILDFFAGSGTTGHAVMELNKIDGGNRSFILCTNNEDNNGDGFRIADDMCYPRIKNVIYGYKGLIDGKNYDGLGGNLKYYRTAFVPAEPTDKNKIKLTTQATEMLCIKEGTFDNIVDTKDYKIFSNTEHNTGIIWNHAAIPDFKERIKDIEGPFRIYVFSLGDETFSNEFADIKKRVELLPIPEVILRVYRSIFK